MKQPPRDPRSLPKHILSVNKVTQSDASLCDLADYFAHAAVGDTDALQEAVDLLSLHGLMVDWEAA